MLHNNITHNYPVSICNTYRQKNILYNCFTFPMKIVLICEKTNWDKLKNVSQLNR